jgi:uncharacterized protein (TIGR03435 family)
MNTMRLGWTLVHFLWQGGLIAIVYAVARRFLRGPNDRYLLACAALALMLAAPIATWFALAPADSAPPIAADQTTRVPSNVPSALPAMVRAEVPAVKDIPWLRWAVTIWLTGASLLSLRLLGGWLMAARLRWIGARPAPLAWSQTVERLRQQLGVLRSVSLQVSAMVQSPVVIGAWRPLILVPVGMLAGMPAAQVEALLIHELAHIRRHDYLVNLLQSVAEALLFYHPAVWWVSRHIRAERERCCDDAAVALSGDVLGYVNALAELAGSRTVRLAAVAANGGSLADRIAHLLGQPRPAARKRGTMAAAILLAAAAFGLYAQEAPRPSFQVASVKPNTDNPPNRSQHPLPGGRWSAKNATLAMMIVTSYKVQRYQLVGGPSWIESDGFDIEATADPDAKAPQLLLMMQSLLADRFKLTMHRENKELPVYNLSGARGTFNPPPPDSGCVPPDPAAPPAPGATPCGNMRIGMSGSVDGASVPMGQLVATLAAILGHPVIDKTSYTGMFDVHLKFTPDQLTQGLPGGSVGADLPDPDPTRPDFLTAVQEQVGLKLTSSKGPVEVLVIDHVERPTAN